MEYRGSRPPSFVQVNELEEPGIGRSSLIDRRKFFEIPHMVACQRQLGVCDKFSRHNQAKFISDVLFKFALPKSVLVEGKERPLLRKLGTKGERGEGS